MDKEHARVSSRWRFRLRTLLALTTAISALVLFVVLEYRKQVNERTALEELIFQGGSASLHVSVQSWMDRIPSLRVDHVHSLSFGSIACVAEYGPTGIAKFYLDKFDFPDSIDLSRIVELRFLNNLRVETRLLSEEDLNKIAEVKSLESLTLYSGPLSAEALADLFDKLPNLKFVELSTESVPIEDRPVLVAEFHGRIIYTEVDWNSRIDRTEQLAIRKAQEGEAKSDSIGFDDLIEIY